MVKHFRNNSGFTLVEVMIVAGMLGFLSLGVVKVVDMITTSGKKMSSQLTEAEIYRRITTNLADSNACLSTLRTIGAQKHILNKNGSRLYSTGDKVGHIKIKDISSFGGTGTGNKTVTITVKLERLNLKSGVKIISKTFKVDAKYINGVVHSCYLDKENLVSTALDQVQQGLASGAMQFPTLNLTTPDGKTGIIIENDQIIIKGNIQIEDQNGDRRSLMDYIVEKIRSPDQYDIPPVQKDTEYSSCSQQNFKFSKTIEIKGCPANADSDGSCETVTQSSLNCDCMATIPEGKQGDTKTAMCHNSAIKISANRCLSTNSGKNCQVDPDSLTYGCPSYIQKAYCDKGRWVKQ